MVGVFVADVQLLANRKPIPKKQAGKIARLTNERWADVEPSLQEFFCDNGEEWVHLRIEEDLASVREN